MGRQGRTEKSRAGKAATGPVKRVRADKALRQGGDDYRALIESALDVIVVLNADRTVRYMSPAFVREIGEDRRDRNPFEFLHPDDVPYAAEVFERLLQSPGATERVEIRGQHLDGSWGDFEVIARNLFDDPQVAGIVANFRDVTERKRAEEALRESERRFREIFNNVTDEILISDASGTIIWVNDRCWDLFGYRPDEVMGRSYTDLDILEPDEMARMAELISESLARKDDAPVLVEARVKHRDGHDFPVEVSTNTVWAADGTFEYFVNIIRDITERKRTEEALRRQQEYFRALIENSMEGITVVNADGTVSYEGPSSGRVLGYKPAELLGENGLELVHPDDLGRASEAFARVIDSPEETVCTELRVRHKDGSWRYIEATAQNLLDHPAVGAVVVNFRDITERKQAEEALRKAHEGLETRVHERTAELAEANLELQTEIAERRRVEETLRESEQRYRLLAENVTDVITSTDLNLKPTYMSPSISRLLGYTVEECMNRTIEEALTPTSRELAMEKLARQLEMEQQGQDRGVGGTEFEFYRKDGSTVWVDVRVSILRDANGDPVGLVNQLRDVTERRRMVDALRESEEHYAALVENLSDAVFKFKDGVVVWCNDRVEDIYGYPKGEIMGKDASFFLPQEVDAAEYVRTAFPSIIETGHFSDTATVTRRDGRRADVEFSFSMIPGKQPVELVAVARDVTARKEAEREKERMEQQLLLTGRLAAVGELAAGVAHELNNPLAAVQAYSQFLVSTGQLDSTIKSDLETIYKEAQRASRITANLLSFSRRHKPEKSLISINEVVESSLELHHYRMKVNNIEVVTELEPGLPHTMADYHQLQQVFVNLITNAEQAMTEANGEGRLTVSTREVRGQIRVTFTDNGPGIPEQDISRVFDPFFTTKEVGKGTGLGLSLCFGIVDDHGGRLYATSKPGEGAVFVVEVPVISEPQVAGQAKSTRT